MDIVTSVRAPNSNYEVLGMKTKGGRLGELSKLSYNDVPAASVHLTHYVVSGR